MKQNYLPDCSQKELPILAWATDLMLDMMPRQQIIANQQSTPLLVLHSSS